MSVVCFMFSSARYFITCMAYIPKMKFLANSWHIFRHIYFIYVDNYIYYIFHNIYCSCILRTPVIMFHANICTYIGNNVSYFMITARYFVACTVTIFHVNVCHIFRHIYFIYVYNNISY